MAEIPLGNQISFEVAARDLTRTLRKDDTLKSRSVNNNFVEASSHGRRDEGRQVDFAMQLGGPLNLLLDTARCSTLIE